MFAVSGVISSTF